MAAATCLSALLERLIADGDRQTPLMFVPPNDVQHVLSARTAYTQQIVELTLGIQDLQFQDVLSALASSWCLDTQPHQHS